MAVAFDAAAESVRTGTGTTQDWTHTPVGVPRAVIVTVVSNGSAPDSLVTAITYGGVPLSRVDRGYDNSTEPGVAEIWFLGERIPAGAQTVSAAVPSASGNDMQFVSMTYTADRDCELVDYRYQDQDATNPSLTVAAGGRTCAAVGVIFSGHAAPSSLTPNQTAVHDHDFGNQASRVQRGTSTFTTTQALSYTAAVEDAGQAVIAFSEVDGRFPVVKAQWGLGQLVSPPTSTDVPVQMDPGRAIRDRVIVAIATRDGLNTITWPTGWTQIFQGFAAANTVLTIRYRDLDGSGNDPGATLTPTLASAVITAGRMWVLKAGTFDPTVAPECATSVTGNTTAPNAGSLSPSWGAMNTLWITLTAWEQGQRFLTGSPSNYFAVVTDRSDNALGMGIGSGFRPANASSEDAGAWTLSNAQQWVATTIGVKPLVTVGRPGPGTYVRQTVQRASSWFKREDGIHVPDRRVWVPGWAA